MDLSRYDRKDSGREKGAAFVDEKEFTRLPGGIRLGGKNFEPLCPVGEFRNSGSESKPTNSIGFPGTTRANRFVRALRKVQTSNCVRLASLVGGT